MNYRKRGLEEKVRRLSAVSPAVLIVGARQVGKSTLLSHLFPEARHVVFDPVVDVGGARRDPEFFLQQHPPPLILDEIQFAPELLPVLKRRIDEDPRPGLWFLTGSQNFAVLRNASESLAGRVAVLELHPFSLAEGSGEGGDAGPSWVDDLFAADAAARLKERKRLPAPSGETVFRRLWRGGFPRLVDLDDAVVPDILGSYLSTYVERDVRMIAAVEDQHLFGRFLGLCAALTAQEANHSHLGRELGVASQTAHRWLRTLAAGYQWIEVPAFSANAVKRVSRRPKGFFADTGLACHLHRLSSPGSLSGSPLLGPLFETLVAMEIVKLSARSATAPRLWHWRSHGGAEVDLLLERDGKFIPVEMKATPRPVERDARGIRAFRETHPSLAHGRGIVVSTAPEAFELRDRIVVIPYDLA